MTQFTHNLDLHPQPGFSNVRLKTPIMAGYGLNLKQIKLATVSDKIVTKTTLTIDPTGS